MMADADHPTWKRIENRRQRDIDFLAWVKSATLDELLAEFPNHRERSWQQVAITRRIKSKQEGHHV